MGVAVGVPVAAAVGVADRAGVGVGPGVVRTVGVAVGVGAGGEVGFGAGAAAPITRVVVAMSEPELVLAEMRPVLPFAAPVGITNWTPKEPRVAAVNWVITPPL